jgi:transcriptional regulator with XRE-family HTH domain
MATGKSAIFSKDLQVFHSEDICEHVGNRIRALRLAKRWSQQILADHAELSKVHIIAVEKGRAEVGLRALQRIALALGVRVRDLIDP